MADNFTQRCTLLDRQVCARALERALWDAGVANIPAIMSALDAYVTAQVGHLAAIGAISGAANGQR